LQPKPTPALPPPPLASAAPADDMSASAEADALDAAALFAGQVFAFASSADALAAASGGAGGAGGAGAIDGVEDAAAAAGGAAGGIADAVAGVAAAADVAEFEAAGGGGGGGGALAALAPGGAATFSLVRPRRCGVCRACAHPAWKQRCERNAAAAAAAGIPQRRKKSSLLSSPAYAAAVAAAAAAGAGGGGGGGGAPAGPSVAWPVRPKRPKTAFLLFAEAHHRAYRAAHPAASFAEVAERTGQAWKALAPAERAPHEAGAAAAAAAHAAVADAFRRRVSELLAEGHALPAHLAGKRKGGGGGGGGGGGFARAGALGDDDSSGGSESEDDGTRATRWEECGPCARWVVVADGADGAPVCAECGGPVVLTEGAALESWVQCDACGKWREVSKGALRALAAQGEAAAWTCAMRRPGATCKSGADDWGAKRRRAARAAAAAGGPAAAAAGMPADVAERHAAPAADSKRTSIAWAPALLASYGGASAPAPAHGPTGGMHGAPCGGVRPATRCEFVPGRDTLIDCSTLAAGLDAHDARTGELILFTAPIAREDHRLALPFVHAAIRAYYLGRLPELRDGRESSGLIDLAAFLAEPRHAEAVEAALFRRRARRAAAAAAAVAAAEAEGRPPPAPEPTVTRYAELNYVVRTHTHTEAFIPCAHARDAHASLPCPAQVHVKHNQRAVYIGEARTHACMNCALLMPASLLRARAPSLVLTPSAAAAP
jgi:hypothetical protein